MNETNEAIVKAVVYADIFDYPLSSEELQRYLIRDNLQCQRHPELVSGSDQMLKLIQHDGCVETDGEYFFLKNRKEIVALRKKREKWSQEKLKMAEKSARWLSLIPWIKMVGVTGSLAMKNSGRNDDIDLLIVADVHRLWLTRFLATILMEMMGKRRRPLNKEGIKDKICLNMYLDEDHLQVPIQEHDLFTAHEVVQVKLLWDKDGIYNKFLTENLWIKKYLPNTSSRRSLLAPAKPAGEVGFQQGETLQSHLQSQSWMTFFKLLNLFEKIAKAFQLWYMKSRRTTEVISNGIIRFHPKDARKWVLTRYQSSLKIALIEKE